MDDRFNKFVEPFVLPHETEFEKGHYGDYDHTRVEKDPDDPGNYLDGKLLGTKFGIDARSYGGDPSNLTKQDAINEYDKNYWQKFNCAQYPYPFGEVFCDTCINNGVARAKQLISVSNGDASKFLQERENFYIRLAQKPKAKKYLKGWLNRAEDLAKFLNVKIQHE